MRKKLISLLSLVLILTAVLCGCQNNSDTSGVDGELTKSEWAGLLGDKFGYHNYENTEDFYLDVSSDNENYDEIQACAEWEVLPEKGSFHPNDTVTWKYAIETSVRAIGVDKLNNSEIDMEVTEGNLVEFFTSKIAGVDAGNLDVGLSKEEANLILTYAYQYAANLTLVERMEYTYNEDVKEASAESITLKGDGLTAVVNDAASYQVGDVIYVQPAEGSAAYAVRVDSVQGNEISYEMAGMEDVYQEIQVSGTYEATIIGIEPAEGVNISVAAAPSEQGVVYASYASGEQQNMLQSSGQNGGVILTGKNETCNNIKFETYAEAALSVDISDIMVTTDVDYGIFKGLKKAEATLSFNDKVSVEYKAGAHMSSQIPLGTLTLSLGPTPLTVKVSLVANVGLDGEVTITYSSRVVAMVNYQKGKGLNASVSNENPDCDFHAEVTATVEPCLKLELCCLGMGLANVKVTSGIVSIAQVDMDLLGDDPLCIDLFMYVPLRWAVNEDGCLMTDISKKLKVSQTVWESDNSPIQLRFHWEDGVLVEACTRGKEKVETPVVDENGEPYDEYKIFDFEEVVFGFIKVASQNLYLSKGESMSIGILSVPDGYSTGTLVYQSQDPSVCTISNGVITAVGSGSTTIRISTMDGKYSVYLTVVVEMEYNDTSGFQSL